MPNKRLSMRKVREILRLKFEGGLSNRAIARSVSLSPTSVSDCLLRCSTAGIVWPLDPELDDAQLEAQLYPGLPADQPRQRAPLAFSHVHTELRRKGVTLLLLWQEYKAEHPEDGYQYSCFCDHYRRWRGKLDVVMRQTHRAGERLFTDFSGDGIDIIDPKTGVVNQAELFVAVLGASGYTFAEAFESQELRFWIQAHIHAFEYCGGVPEIVVPDNTRTAVTHPCRYEPDLNPTFLELANHYNTVVIPARVQKPKDKAKVENGVLLAQRWILAALRNHQFFSVAQANEAIAEKLEELNDRKLQLLDTTRRALYESLDRPALKPLPQYRYELAQWSEPRVNIDYHVDVERHYYSVPYTLVHKKVDARRTATTVEIFFKNRRVASHKRSYQRGGYTTLKEHMPKAHQQYLEWTPSRILKWAATSGPFTGQLASKIMETKRHPEQGYRACLGVLRLGKAYGNDRLEAACERALTVGTHSYKSVQSILKNGLDRQPLPEITRKPEPVSIDHENIRGAEYYQ
jgi:transposase